MTLDIHVLDWDMYKDMKGLNKLTELKPCPLDN